MKIIFEDKSYIEIKKEPDKILVVIGAKDAENHRKYVVNSCELTKEQFESLCADIV